VPKIFDLGFGEIALREFEFNVMLSESFEYFLKKIDMLFECCGIDDKVIEIVDSAFVEQVSRELPE
jgi:hypothetical protein